MAVPYYLVYFKTSDYKQGRCSAQDVVDFFNAHRAHEPHLLWESGHCGQIYAQHCFENLPEEKLFELL